MAIDSGPQYGVKHTLTGPDGTIAVFNDDTDPNYVGVLSNVSGTDSPEVRENAADLVEQHGGVHGRFWYGRRPVVLTGDVLGATAAQRNARLTRLQRASNAMHADADLKWTPDGGAEQFVKVRRQQPLRIEGGWMKSFQLALVAADPRIYSTGLYTVEVEAAVGGATGRSYPRQYPYDYGGATVAAQANVTNEGSWNTPALLTLHGPLTNPQVRNATVAKTISFIYTLAAGERLVIDTDRRTIMLNGDTPRYSALDFSNTDWWNLEPGLNDIRLQVYDFQVGAKMVVDWRYAWV